MSKLTEPRFYRDFYVIVTPCTTGDYYIMHISNSLNDWCDKSINLCGWIGDENIDDTWCSDHQYMSYKLSLMPINNEEDGVYYNVMGIEPVTHFDEYVIDK